MIRLETVEDFEKVKKALEDPGSLQREYCICPYSYCFQCGEVKEFEAPAWRGLRESISVKCSAGHYFMVVYPYTNEIIWGVQFDDKLPPEFVNEVRRLNSREMQRNFFTVELERRITREKSELRRTQDRIQKFACLRS